MGDHFHYRKSACTIKKKYPRVTNFCCCFLLVIGGVGLLLISYLTPRGPVYGRPFLIEGTAFNIKTCPRKGGGEPLLLLYLVRVD